MAWIVKLILELGNIKVKKIPSGLLTKGEVRFLKKKISKLLMEGEEAFLQGLYLNAHKNYIIARQLGEIVVRRSPEVPLNLSESTEVPFNLPESINQIDTKIKLTEDKINAEKLNLLALVIEKGDNLKRETKFSEANNEYQKAFKIIEEMVIIHQEIRDLKVEGVYVKQIQNLISQGVKLKTEKFFDSAIEIFNQALKLSEKKLNSAEKEQVINDIKKRGAEANDIYIKQVQDLIAEGIKLKSEKSFYQALKTSNNALNLSKKMFPSSINKQLVNKLNELKIDIYNDMVKENVELGKHLKTQEKVDEANQRFNIALNLIGEKYSFSPQTISSNFNKANEIREINSLISQIESK